MWKGRKPAFFSFEERTEEYIFQQHQKSPASLAPSSSGGAGFPIPPPATSSAAPSHHCQFLQVPFPKDRFSPQDISNKCQTSTLAQKPLWPRQVGVWVLRITASPRADTTPNLLSQVPMETQLSEDVSSVSWASVWWVPEEESISDQTYRHGEARGESGSCMKKTEMLSEAAEGGWG